MDVYSKKKLTCPHPRSHAEVRDTNRSEMHYLCFRRARKPAERQVGRYISSERRRHKSGPFSLSFYPLLCSLSLSLSLSLPLPNYAPPLMAIPQVVVPVRVIQDINAETDVGVDRRVSFSPFSWTDNLSQWCFLDSLSTHDVLGERRRLIRSRLINHAIN